MFLILKQLFLAEIKPSTMSEVFMIGMPEKEGKFAKALSEYVLEEFWPKLKQHAKVDKEVEARARAAFAVIRKKAESEFVAASLM